VRESQLIVQRESNTVINLACRINYGFYWPLQKRPTNTVHTR